MGITSQSVIELHIRNCRCCHHYHLLYFYPVFDSKLTQFDELWLVSTKRGLLFESPFFTHRMFSGEVHRSVFNYGAPMCFLESSICLLDVPNRCVMLNAAFLMSDASQFPPAGSELLWWNQFVDYVVDPPILDEGFEDLKTEESEDEQSF